ncbi:MEDS domain-containing protein [Actinoplanes sp. NPDC049681]|uniref:MEDS domain-containing protein n=1 Tax=Actinoplanes sp. NPDC049681 TaxID=3363905 RepID=UPI00378FDEEB
MTGLREGWDSTVAGLGAARHVMLLYGPDRAWIGDWVRRGLRAGEKILYPVDAGGSAPPLPDILDERGVDVTTATARGDLLALPSELYLRPGDLAAAVRGALQRGYPAVRVVAGIGASLSEQEYAASEQILNDVCLRYPATVLCPYREDDLTDEQIRDFAVWHPHARHRYLELRRRDRTVVVAGQADFTNERLLRGVLSTAVAAALAASAVLYLDVEALALISAAGWRALAQGSTDLRERGGRLVLISPQPAVARMIKLLRLDVSISAGGRGSER